LNKTDETVTETAYFYSDDMIIEVYSNQSKTGRPLPHAHLKTVKGDFLGTFAITKQTPSDETKVLDCHKEMETSKSMPIPSKYKKKIVKWAIKKYSYLHCDDGDGSITNWGALKLVVKILNRDREIL
jgi:hypothetical protein